MSKAFNDKLREIASKVHKDLPGIQFSILVFSPDHPGYSNYVTTTSNEKMITAMEELIQKMRSGQTKRE